MASYWCDIIWSAYGYHIDWWEWKWKNFNGQCVMKSGAGCAHCGRTKSLFFPATADSPLEKNWTSCEQLFEVNMDVFALSFSSSLFYDEEMQQSVAWSCVVTIKWVTAESDVMTQTLTGNRDFPHILAAAVIKLGVTFYIFCHWSQICRLWCLPDLHSCWRFWAFLRVQPLSLGSL